MDTQIEGGGSETSRETTLSLKTEERELASRLKAVIDRSGRYSYRLDDMAAGFAAGRDITPIKARAEIERHFKSVYSVSPKEYMDRRYHELEQTRGRSSFRGR